MPGAGFWSPDLEWGIGTRIVGSAPHVPVTLGQPVGGGGDASWQPCGAGRAATKAAGCCA